MHSLLRTIACIGLCSTCLTAEETKAPPARRARPAPVVSPDLGKDGSVTFRYKAPGAKEVKVSGQFGKEATLTKDDSGEWSVTVPAVPPGVHEYQFRVDGTGTIDSLNTAVKPQRWPSTSILHIPSSPPALWDWQDIPHGTVHEHTYASKALGQQRRIFVYTPPGAGAEPLPVFYLAHGYSDNEGTWTAHGKAHWIMDALLAAKKAVPMIIVMPDAHAIAPGAAGFEDYAPANTDALCRELVQDILPLVESTYKTIPQPASRAFAGLSMGGHHALSVALNHHDKFQWIGAFSSAPPKTETVTAGLDNAAATNKDLKLFWIACGKADFLYNANNDFTALLKTKGVTHEYVQTEGDHSWPIWRKYLIDFAPKLFR